MITLPEQIIMGRAWQRVECAGVLWDVAPDYVFPVGIGEAELHADAAGCELPSPALVDAIWASADLQLPPLPRGNDGKPGTMSTAEAYADQARRIEAQLGADAGKYSLLAGTHKDVVRLSSGGLGLYGWHVAGLASHYRGIEVHPPVTPHLAARVIQQPFGGHGAYWKDYSQGLRLVRRA